MPKSMCDLLVKQVLHFPVPDAVKTVWKRTLQSLGPWVSECVLQKWT